MELNDNTEEVLKEEMMFVDAQEMHNQYSDTFYAPNEKELREIKPNWYVKVCSHDERFWLKVTKVEEDKITGTVNNELFSAPYAFGDELTVDFRNVYDILEGTDRCDAY